KVVVSYLFLDKISHLVMTKSKILSYRWYVIRVYLE
ncbi:MAG: hypothetical protein ACI92O_004109, partial [Colwellia sp.]